MLYIVSVFKLNKKSADLKLVLLKKKKIKKNQWFFFFALYIYL